MHENRKANQLQAKQARDTYDIEHRFARSRGTPGISDFLIHAQQMRPDTRLKNRLRRQSLGRVVASRVQYKFL